MLLSLSLHVFSQEDIEAQAAEIALLKGRLESLQRAALASEEVLQQHRAEQQEVEQV